MNYFTHLFYKRQLNSGVLLIFASLAAIIVANSSLSGWYYNILSQPVAIQFGSFNLFSHHGESMTFLELINDGLMAIFFFMVGLEIKREIIVGELSSVRQALLPIVAACGGMLVPILIFLFISPDSPASAGFAIPMATDIAFAIGILGLLGDRVPVSLKVFLTALAVVDDIGGILIIALFYNTGIAWNFLLISFALFFILFLANRFHVSSKLFYVIMGIVTWAFFTESGIHATIAGVIIAFAIPARQRMDVGKYVEIIRENINLLPNMKCLQKGESVVLTNSQIAVLKQVESASDRVISPLQDMEDGLHRVVNFIIMPLFAFANAGVSFEGFTPAIFMQGVTLSVMAGLILGKFLGIFSFTWITIKLRFVRMPIGMNWHNLAGVSLLGGIGFTVSLFIANLSYSRIPEVGNTLLNHAKIGIIFGSILSGLLGVVYLNMVLHKKKKRQSKELHKGR